MAWRIRRALAEDATALALIAGATFLETYHHIIPVADLVAHVSGKSGAAIFTAWIDDQHSGIFYAGADGTDAPVGYAVLTAPDFPTINVDARDLELRRIYTLATTHGSGLGRALLDSVVVEARERGAARLLLGTHPENLRARRFYERAGFDVIGTRSFAVGEATFVDPVYALAL